MRHVAPSARSHEPSGSRRRAEFQRVYDTGTADHEAVSSRSCALPNGRRRPARHRRVPETRRRRVRRNRAKRLIREVFRRNKRRAGIRRRRHSETRAARRRPDRLEVEFRALARRSRSPKPVSASTRYRDSRAGRVAAGAVDVATSCCFRRFLRGRAASCRRARTTPREAVTPHGAAPRLLARRCGVSRGVIPFCDAHGFDPVPRQSRPAEPLIHPVTVSWKDAFSSPSFCRSWCCTAYQTFFVAAAASRRPSTTAG